MNPSSAVEADFILSEDFTAEGDFTQSSIGFHCKRTGLCYKDRFFCSLVRRTGLEPVWLPTRPSNVRVCHFRHPRVTQDLLYLSAEVLSIGEGAAFWEKVFPRAI